MSADALFRPFQIKGLTLPNRLVMAPMTRSFSPGGVPTADVAAYYRRRAEGQVGLIITEGTGVNRPASTNDPAVPYIHGEAALAGWKGAVDAVHGAGGLIAPQLWHVGSVRGRTPGFPPGPSEGPSGFSSPGKKFGEPMTIADIEATIAAFGQAAADSRRIGFDAIEIHGAHGYLIDQFFWSETNKRTDLYGGASIFERSRFAAEVVRAVRKAVGPDTVIILRVSQWKQQDFPARIALTPQELEEWLAPLGEAGVDVFHCSQRRFWEPEFEGSDLNFAGWTKKVTGKPTITVGSVGLSGEFVAAFAGEASKPASIDGLLARLEREEFDLVAVGRALVVDPDWAVKIRDGRHGELSEYSRDALATLV